MSERRPWQCPHCTPAQLPTPRWAPGPLLELDAGSVADLLDDLHDRLRERSARAAVYVVGGAALLLAHGRNLATADIDVAHLTTPVDDAARDLAHERGLSMRWLNASAAPWIPPRPECALDEPAHDGLTVHLAPPRHLLAMKLAAWRAKDEDDLADLLEACGLAGASADQVADVLYETYTVEDSLAGMLGVPGHEDAAVRDEALARAAAALALL